MKSLPDFFTGDLLKKLDDLAGTPCFLYDEAHLRKQAALARGFPAPYDLFPRFAMKACPTRSILQLFREEGFGIDASSGYEVDRALRAGFPPDTISLSTQELPDDFAQWVEQGVALNACSLSQLQRYGQRFPGREVGLRFNPGLGSGGTGKTNVGGPSSSFGIWHEKWKEATRIVTEFSLKPIRIHTHIGSGSDPKVWQKVAHMSLELVRKFPGVHILNLGGGYKVGRVEGEKSTDLHAIAQPVYQALEEFAAQTGRKIKLEIEPGTFLVANGGYLVSSVQDMVDTGKEGHRFLKLNSGMTELLRPSLYAAQHPIWILPRSGSANPEPQPFVVVGHCCESGDLVSPDPGDAEALSERSLPTPHLGDFCVIGGAGAYCSSMSTKNYNSFPEAAEVLVGTDHRLKLIRKRQTLDQILANEL